MTFMHGLDKNMPLRMLGNAKPISAGHCYRSHGPSERRRLLTLQALLSDHLIERNSKLAEVNLDAVRAVLAMARFGAAPAPLLPRELLQDAHVANSMGRAIEIMLLEGSLQGRLLHNVIAASCMQEEQLIRQDPDSEFGSRPIQQPPIGNATLAQAIAAKVEPWLNLSEFLQTCGGVRMISPSGSREAWQFCDCDRHLDRYEWRQSVRRLHPLARPFFGLYEEDTEPGTGQGE